MDTLSIGGLLSRATSVITNNPVVTIGGAFLLSALPTELLNMALRGALAIGPASFSPVFVLANVALGLVLVFSSLLVQATIIRSAAAQARGERASFGECLATGLGKVLPLFLLTILVSLGLFAGFILLIVPGIILLLMWCVASPALVVENLGPVEALGRSRELTKGYRWKVFGIFLLMLILVWIVSALLGVILVLSVGLGGLESMASSIEGGNIPIGYTLASLLLNTLYGAFVAALPVSLYLTLREIKEGPQSEQLASVFA
jgi:uncharacterized membrane protein